MKFTILSIVFILVLMACSSGSTTIPADAVDTAVAQTLTAAPTQEPLPTNTAERTDTEIPTDTLPPPTDTPTPIQIVGAECIPA